MDHDVGADEVKMEEKKVGIFSVFSSRTMTKVTLVLWVNWIVVILGYFGISLGIGDVGPNLFVNFMLVKTSCGKRKQKGAMISDR